jgi:hypothetical protein
MTFSPRHLADIEKPKRLGTQVKRQRFDQKAICADKIAAGEKRLYFAGPRLE